MTSTSKPLKDLSAFITKGATPTTYGFKWESDGVRFLRSECVSARGLDLTQSMFISEAANRIMSRSEVTDGDLLMTITGNVGRVVRVEGLSRANINQHIARIRLSSSMADSGYVYHYLSQSTVRDYFETITTGQAYPQISLSQVRDTEIPLPPIEVQRHVAEMLTVADGSIASLERLIAKKQAIKQGMMQRLLTGTTRLPGFDGPWAPTVIGSLGYFLKGRGVTRDDVRPSGIPCIRYGELYTTFHDYTDVTVSFVSNDVAATALPIIEGDLLFAGSGETKAEIGTCVAYVGQSAAVAGGDIVVLRAPKVNAIFLASLLNTPEVAAMKSRSGQGDAVVHISARAIGALRVDLPGRSEQDAIARVIVDADQELVALDARLVAVRNIKQGMMQRLLTGRIGPARMEATS